MTYRLQVEGCCPMGCGSTLFLGFDSLQPKLRRVWCSHPNCPRPTAVNEILADSETEHIVTLDAGGYLVKHPLRERLDNELLRCPLSSHVAEFGPEYVAGVFGEPIPLDVPHRVWWIGEGENATTEWERL